MAMVRRARPEDAKGIHEAHMRSIREVCAPDYTLEEVSAWGGRPFNEQQRQRAIEKDFVWVVDAGGVIQGYGHLTIEEKEGAKTAYVVALYLAPEAKGRGFGAEIMARMVEEARGGRAKDITLEATITAHAFYRKLGFSDTGPERRAEVNGVGVRCYPMALVFGD